jgi:peptide/nickel transport system substrate-binding protein
MSRTLRWLWLLGLLVAIAAVHAKPLRWAVRSEPQSLDPHAVLDATGPTGNIYSLIYDSLTQRDREQRVVPRLATTWELVDDTTWRFKLRDDVKFHDGSPLTADDVVFSIERAQQPSSPWAWVARRFGKPVRLDSTTVELRMLTPHPLLLESLEFVPIMSRAWCLAHGVERVPDHKAGEVSYSSRNAMGSGPFVLKSWQPGGRLVLTRNPHWFAGHCEARAGPEAAPAVDRGQWAGVFRARPVPGRVAVLERQG